MNDNDLDIPVLTDIIDAKAAAAPAHAGTPSSSAMPDLDQIQDTLSQRLVAELALQIPVLVEAALRERLPHALGARLQAELLTVLTNALPVAAQAATAELSTQIAYEVGGLLEQRLQEEVRIAVSNEIAALTARQS
jgi:hypothetical protein